MNDEHSGREILEKLNGLEKHVKDLQNRVEDITTKIDEIEVSTIEVAELAIGVSFTIFAISDMIRYSIEPYHMITVLMALIAGFYLVIDVGRKIGRRRGKRQ